MVWQFRVGERVGKDCRKAGFASACARSVAISVPVTKNTIKGSFTLLQGYHYEV
jgi:hypothetical protein